MSAKAIGDDQVKLMKLRLLPLPSRLPPAPLPPQTTAAAANQSTSANTATCLPPLALNQHMMNLTSNQ
ncbi:hypothetical protein Pmani_013412 [Petrolisthes manimaculis]|uniref:Uncharacterized protein n=1 Tax=Petrolisthes manimaculis TaxID=1843537 RepID=A0AAE1PVR1_9EUCA|nr:hypothetical protein Pmani_013412 [Petrolisthes manimaculis]